MLLNGYDIYPCIIQNAEKNYKLILKKEKKMMFIILDYVKYLFEKEKRFLRIIDANTDKNS